LVAVHAVKKLPNLIRLGFARIILKIHDLP